MALLSTLVEDFNSTTINSSLWTSSGTATTVTQPSGQLKFTTSTTSGYASYQSVNTYDLTSSYACVEVVDAGNQSLTSLEVYALQMVKDSSNIVSFIISGGNLKAYKRVAGTNTQLATITYNNTTMRFLRIREAAGTTYWEYSATRASWTALHSVANPIVVTAVKQEFSVGTYSAEASATTVLFDNFNYNTKILYGTLVNAANTSGTWSNIFNAADIDATTAGPNISTYSETTTNGSYNTNILVLSNPNIVNVYKNAVVGVRIRMYGQARASGNYVYADITGAANSPNIYVYGNTPSWTSWQNLTAPAGGWTQANLANIVATCYIQGGGTTNTGKVYGVQLEYTIIADKPTSLVDTFVGTTMDTVKWSASASGGGTSTQNNLYYIYQGGGSSGFAELFADYAYDLSNSSFYFQAKADYVDPAFLDIGTVGRIRLNISSTTLSLVVNGTTIFSYTLPNTNPIYIKVREASGVLYVDTSADNVTYTNRGSATLSTYSIDFTANPMKLWFYVWNGGAL